jgi:demethylmenaquinone methyltransferase/2-methoxy-6-polyprenyl-1,4-benzoquinol methylase
MDMSDRGAGRIEPAEKKPDGRGIKGNGIVWEDGKRRNGSICGLFSRIAPVYDGLNRLLSLGRDRYWRKALTALAEPPPAARILDICTGTADLAIALARSQRSARITGVDFSAPMLRLGEKKIGRNQLREQIRLQHADAHDLPFQEGAFDLVSVSFGLRNLADVQRGLSEMSRVLKTGGRIVVLEFAPPTNSLWGRVYGWYLANVVPILGGMISGFPKAYRHLHSSIVRFKTQKQMIAMIEDAGLADCNARALSGGIAWLYTATKKDTAREIVAPPQPCSSG